VGGKPEARGPLERLELKGENNIKMYLREIGLKNVDWVYLARVGDRCMAVVNTVMNLQVL
jgi:hypothetical protein